MGANLGMLSGLLYCLMSVCVRVVWWMGVCVLAAWRRRRGAVIVAVLISVLLVATTLEAVGGCWLGCC